MVTSETVRTITDDEFGDFINVVHTAFLAPPSPPEGIETRRVAFDLDRCLGAFDRDGRLCGAARAFPTELTVPGGTVAAGAVSGVGVLPTHRRQGHLRRMMHTQLDDIVRRGEPVATLVAAEYPIYGRYGYGLAVEACELHLDADRAQWLAPDSDGSVELVDNDTFAKVIVDVYDRARPRFAGHITYEPARWDVFAGVRSWPDGDDDARHKATKVVWYDAQGEPQAATAYSVDERWEHNRPAGTLSAGVLVATSGHAEVELVRFLASVDWVAQVHVGLRPLDNPVPLALADARLGALVNRSDHLWVRVLDVAAALTARRYATEGSLVFEVVDPLGHAAGRFVLDGGPDGATCAATDAEPHLVVPIGALGAAYLGGTGWGRLAELGWVDERRPGAMARVAAMFGAPRAPWCVLSF